VSTVEHLLAALSALGVDNVDVGVRGPEVPVLDGSAQPWVDAIERAGLVEQDAPLRQLVIEHAIEFRMGWRVARVVPSDQFVVSAQIAFDHARIGARRSPSRSRTASSATRSPGRAPSASSPRSKR
jgi:UDP-3-O-[3-hydroxymyristoyl] N-acetylglucosamine deacetylase